MTWNCESKLHGFRRTLDGVVVSFVIHPNEVPQDLALDPLGTRYQLAGCAVTDDEQPRDPAATPAGKTPPEDRLPPPSVSSGGANRRSEAAKTAYANKLPEEQYSARAAMLTKDKVFQEYVCERLGWQGSGDAEQADAFIKRVCDIESKSDFLRDERARVVFDDLEFKFRQWAGRFAEDRG